MHQFSWSLQKALEFIQFKRPDVNPKPYFLRQLRRMEKALLRNTRDPVDIAGRWLDQCASPHELVARNTVWTHARLSAPMHGLRGVTVPQRALHQGGT